MLFDCNQSDLTSASTLGTPSEVASGIKAPALKTYLACIAGKIAKELELDTHLFKDNNAPSTWPSEVPFKNLSDSLKVDLAKLLVHLVDRAKKGEISQSEMARHYQTVESK